MKKRIVPVLLCFALLASSVANGQWVVSAAAETSAPLLQSVGVDNSTVPSGSNVALTIKLADSMSGIESAVVQYISPSGADTNSVTLYPDASGELKATISTTGYASLGKWKIDVIMLFDKAGNHTDIYNSELNTTGDLMDLSSGDFQIVDRRFAPTGLKSVGLSAAGASDGKIIGTTNFMEYRLSTESGYKPVMGSEITGLSAGTYCIRYAARDGYSAGTDGFAVIKCQYDVSNGVLVKYYGTGGNVVIPGNLGITSIGDNAFFSCTDLTGITIPEGITGIGDKAFGDCINLKYVSIPNSVSIIGRNAFTGCSNLGTINAYPLMAPTADASIFGSVPSNMVINVLEGAVGYNNAPWSGYTHNSAALLSTSIEVTTPPIKTEYLVGQELNLTGMIVTGTFNDGTKAPVKVTEANISGFDSSKPALGQTVTATVDGKTAAFQVDIIAQPENAASMVNLAAGKLFTSSVFTNLSRITDGSRNTYSLSEDYPNDSGLQYVQVDLGASCNVNDIRLWHYYGDLRKYHDVIIQVSNDPAFATGVTTIFNNDADNSAKCGAGTGNEYIETGAGLDISFEAVSARYVRFYSNGSTMNSNNHYAEIEIYGSRTASVSNLAEGKLFSSPASSNLSVMTDGIINTNSYTDDYPKASGIQYVQVDLGGNYDLSSIKLWHYYGDGRNYHDVIVQISNDPTFTTGVKTVYNNDTNSSAGRGTGTDIEYTETSAGLNIAFDAANGRYVRLYSNGNSVNSNNHYVEIEIYGSKSAAVSNQAAGKTMTSSVNFANLGKVTDGSKNTVNYADCYPSGGLQWIQTDLGISYDISDIKLWHYFGDARKYHDVVVQVSNDPAFASGVTTIYNNDTDGSAGLGIGKGSEYTETSSGLDIPVTSVNARYVRFYSNGSTANSYNHYVELEVYGK